MKNETKDLIIDTASTLFYNKGYNLTGINEIIANADIAKATLYSHFKSKEDLFIAYLDARDKELLENLNTFCKTKPSGDKRLIAIIEFLIPFFNSRDFNGCWCIRSIAEVPKDNQRIKTKIKENKNLFLIFIKDLVKENKPDLSKKKQEILGTRIYLMYESAVAESHLHGEIWPIEENISLLKSMLKNKI